MITIKPKQITDVVKIGEIINSSRKYKFYKISKKYSPPYMQVQIRRDSLMGEYESRSYLIIP